MKRIFLVSRDKGLELKGIEKVEDLEEDISGRIILLDVDTIGFSLLPDLREENLLIALTRKRLPGYVMKLASLGFYDVLSIPVDPLELESVIKRALRELNTREKIVFLPQEDQEELRDELCEELCSIVGGYKSMKEILKLAGKAASTDIPVLITGESGTGKELFAKAIWKLSERWKGPFVALNCSAIPESLLEAELFGYEKGAFTGATSSKPGLIEGANHGVLFLDEIGDLPLSLQPKLLRVIQERKVRRLGGNREIPVNFRLICATNKDLRSLIKEGKFREDLYYRISVVHIHLPPLRERKEDIPELINCILRKVSREARKRIIGYSEGFLRKLLNYTFPGNIRELENILRKAVALNTTGILSASDIRIDYGEGVGDRFEDTLRAEIRKLMKEKPGEVYHSIIGRVSRAIVEEALRETGGNQLLASRILGINRITLRKKLNEEDRRYSSLNGRSGQS